MKMKFRDAVFGILLLALVIMAVYTLSVGFWWLFTTACRVTGINRWAMALGILIVSTVTMALPRKKNGD
nr:MAG TPA: hypothetical protein [Bacteriophage sp.]